MSDLLLPESAGPEVPEGIPTRIRPGRGKKNPGLIKIGKSSIDITDILSNSNLTPGQRRREILVRAGMKTPKKKYETPEERKAAAKARREAKQLNNRNFLNSLGLGPQEKIKLTPEEKKERGKARRKNRREFLKTAALKNPELAAQFNINPKKFKTLPDGFKL